MWRYIGHSRNKTFFFFFSQKYSQISHLTPLELQFLRYRKQDRVCDFKGNFNYKTRLLLHLCLQIQEQKINKSPNDSPILYCCWKVVNMISSLYSTTTDLFLSILAPGHGKYTHTRAHTVSYKLYKLYLILFQ